MNGILLTLAVLSAAPAAKTWQVSGTDVVFTLSKTDLTATRGGQRVFSYADRDGAFQKEHEGMSAEAKKQNQSWSERSTFTPLSVVGGLVSTLEKHDSYMGGAHPSASVSFTAIDVLDPRKPASLYDFFSQQDVVEALRRDPFIRKAIKDREASAKAKDVKGFLATLRLDEDGADACVAFDPQAVEHAFAFHHLEKDKVAVRIAFPYSAEVCRGQSTQVGLLLPIPPALEPLFERAARREEGFLMVDQKKLKVPTVTLSWESE